jgi:hypothetical protein
MPSVKRNAVIVRGNTVLNTNRTGTDSRKKGRHCGVGAVLISKLIYANQTLVAYARTAVKRGKIDEDRKALLKSIATDAEQNYLNHLITCEACEKKENKNG